MRPELVQFADLTPSHFARHPVWIQCHVADHEEPWYDDTDEETFRPCTDALPVHPRLGMLLVHAELVLADGTRLEGFVTPAVEKALAGPDAGLGLMQPQLFAPTGQRISFWDGMFARPSAQREAVYTVLGRRPAAVFPLLLLRPCLSWILRRQW